MPLTNVIADGIEYAEATDDVSDSRLDDRPVVVCLHGIGGDDQSFAPQLSDLPPTYRTVAWCMPGYGRSCSLEALTFDALADALDRLRVHLACDDFHLVGQSIGGMIAQQYAYRFPDRTRSLSLIATTSAFGGRDDSFKDAFLSARLKPLDEGASMADLAKAAIPQIVGPKASPTCIDSATESMAGVSPESYRQTLQCLVTFDLRQQWPTLKCPSCLIAGSVDTNAPARTMQKMAERNPNAEFHEIEGAGHLVNLEMPAATNDILVSFLNSRSVQENSSLNHKKENS